MADEKLSFLRTILKPLGLSDDAIEKTIEFISDLLFEKDEEASVSNDRALENYNQAKVT